MRSLCFADVWVKKRQLLGKLGAQLPPEQRSDPLASWLTARAADYGGTFREELTTGQLTLDPLPASLAIDTGVPSTPIRFVPYNGPAVVPDWLRTPPSRPRVCRASAPPTPSGTAVTTSPRPTSWQLSELDAEVVAALLPAQVNEVGPLPGNVRVVQSVPLHALLPTCSALIHHGGFGSYANALVYGVPQLSVTTPVADQLYRGAGLREQGAGLLLESGTATADDVRRATARLLDEPAFAEHARRLRHEAVSRPSPSDVVPMLEKLAADRRTAPWPH